MVVLAGLLQHPVDIRYRPPVAGRVLVQRRAAQGCQIIVEISACAEAPGIRAVGRGGEQEHLAFQVGVQQGAGQAMPTEGSGQTGDPGWRFAGLGGRRMDEEHAGVMRPSGYVELSFADDFRWTKDYTNAVRQAPR